MHSHITLVLWHHAEHDIPLPLVELRRGEDREARVSFRESDDESTVLVGCPECVATLMRGTADRIEALLREDGRTEEGAPRPGGRPRNPEAPTT